jgi:hypothetical protein
MTPKDGDDRWSQRFAENFDGHARFCAIRLAGAPAISHFSFPHVQLLHPDAVLTIAERQPPDKLRSSFNTISSGKIAAVRIENTLGNR